MDDPPEIDLKGLKPKPPEDDDDGITLNQELPDEEEAAPARIGTAYGGTEAMRVNRGEDWDRTPTDPKATAGEQPQRERPRLYREVNLATGQETPKLGFLRHPMAWLCLAAVAATVAVFMIAGSLIDQKNALEKLSDEQLVASTSGRADASLHPEEGLPTRADAEAPSTKSEDAALTTDEVQPPPLPSESTCALYTLGSGSVRSDKPETYGRLVLTCGDGKLYTASTSRYNEGVWIHKDLSPHEHH